MTPFKSVYGRFLDLIEDDWYIELTESDTRRDMQNILIGAIPKFEFPKKSLDYNLEIDNVSLEDISSFKNDLDEEEINILAYLMLLGWLQRQITSIDNTRQKYYGNSFKLTSQANHLSKLDDLKASIQKDAKYLQRLYKRRVKDAEGCIQSNWKIFNTYK